MKIVGASLKRGLVLRGESGASIVRDDLRLGADGVTSLELKENCLVINGRFARPLFGEVLELLIEPDKFGGKR